MSLKQWADNGWLRPHKTSAKEVAGLLAIVERDLVDAEGEISADWRFGIAYNAALKLCTILLHASGYRPERALQHYRTIAALPLILGDERKDDADYLETCRTKRNTAEYEMAGVATEKDASELVDFVKDLREDVLDWLRSITLNSRPRSHSKRTIAAILVQYISNVLYTDATGRETAGLSKKCLGGGRPSNTRHTTRGSR